MLVLLVAAAGCLWNRPRPVYEFRRGILYPPGRSPASRNEQRPARLVVRLARRPACRALTAAFRGPAVGLSWALEHGTVQVDVEPVVTRFVAGAPLELLDGLRGLRATLASAAARGCLTPAQVRATFARIAGSMPLSPALAQSVLLGPFVAQMFLDVGDPVELQLTYALHRRRPGRYDLGYVAQTYRLTDVRPDGRGRLRLAATAVRSAPPSARPIPPPIELAGGATPAYFRLFFYLRRSPSDHDVALIAGASHAALDAATHALLARPNQCGVLTVAGVRCIVMPPDVGLEARLRVRVKGRWTTVPITATVAQALRAAGVRPPARVLPTLRVLRPYGAGYAPVLPEGPPASLLQLLLSGGEQITW